MSVNASFTLRPQDASALSNCVTTRTNGKQPSFLKRSLQQASDGVENCSNETTAQHHSFINHHKNPMSCSSKDGSTKQGSTLLKSYSPFEVLANERKMSQGPITPLDLGEYTSWQQQNQGTSSDTQEHSGDSRNSATENQSQSSAQFDALPQDIPKLHRLQQSTIDQVFLNVGRDHSHQTSFKALRATPFEPLVSQRNLNGGTLKPFLNPQSNHPKDDREDNWKRRYQRAELARCTARKQLLGVLEENRQLHIQIIHQKAERLSSSQKRPVASVSSRKRLLHDHDEENWEGGGKLPKVNMEEGKDTQLHVQQTGESTNNAMDTSSICDLGQQTRHEEHVQAVADNNMDYKVTTCSNDKSQISIVGESPTEGSNVTEDDSEKKDASRINRSVTTSLIEEAINCSQGNTSLAAESNDEPDNRKSDAKSEGTEHEQSAATMEHPSGVSKLIERTAFQSEEKVQALAKTAGDSSLPVERLRPSPETRTTDQMEAFINVQRRSDRLQASPMFDSSGESSLQLSPALDKKQSEDVATAKEHSGDGSALLACWDSTPFVDTSDCTNASSHKRRRLSFSRAEEEAEPPQEIELADGEPPKNESSTITPRNTATSNDITLTGPDDIIAGLSPFSEACSLSNHSKVGGNCSVELIVGEGNSLADLDVSAITAASPTPMKTRSASKKSNGPKKNSPSCKKPATKQETSQPKRERSNKGTLAQDSLLRSSRSGNARIAKEASLKHSESETEQSKRVTTHGDIPIPDAQPSARSANASGRITRSRACKNPKSMEGEESSSVTVCRGEDKHSNSAEKKGTVDKSMPGLLMKSVASRGDNQACSGKRKTAIGLDGAVSLLDLSAIEHDDKDDEIPMDLAINSKSNDHHVDTDSKVESKHGSRSRSKKKQDVETDPESSNSGKRLSGPRKSVSTKEDGSEEADPLASSMASKGGQRKRGRRRRGTFIASTKAPALKKQRKTRR